MTVALVFPPIVSSAFGSYYPSLPVLAGYLIAGGTEVCQLDLNELLAEYLLAPERLARFGRGDFPDDLSPEHMATVAARLLLKNRDQLFTTDGRHRFSERGETPAYLLSVLAQAFLSDKSVPEILDDIAAASPLTRWYRDFLGHADLNSRLPDDVSLIGVSVPMGPQLFPALILAQALKALRPRVRVVFGGATLSLMQEHGIELILCNSAVDVVVRYEGEAPLLALARQAESKNWSPEQVAGTSSVAGGQVVHKAPGAGVPLDRLPFAHYDRELLRGLDDPEFGVVQTRGCYWGRCAYCDFVELYDGSPRYRGRSPASFVDELDALVQTHGARRFSLITEAIPPSFALKFSELILERGLKIAWSSFAMVDRHFGVRHFEAMVRSGCDHLVIGLETMSDRVLNLVEKYASGDDNDRFLREASAAGISLLVNLIPDLPTTTYQEACDSLARLEALQDTLHGVAIFPFEATRSSRIGRTPERFGITVADADGTSGQAVFADNHLRIIDAGMTEDQRRDVHQRYGKFADRVNARRQHRALVPALGAEPNPELLAVASRDCDILYLEDRIRVFNWVTRERWEAHLGFKVLIERAKRLSGRFTRTELLDGASRVDVIDGLIDQLLEKHIFVAVDEHEEVAFAARRSADVVHMDH